MNDAWNVPGWTSQKPAVIFPDAINVPWKIPSDIDVVAVTANYGDMDGGLPRGYVEFKASSPLFHLPSETDLGTPVYTGTIGMDGVAVLTIPATDSPVLNPTGWTYHVTVVRDAKITDEFDCSLPLATAAVNIKDVTRVTV